MAWLLLGLRLAQVLGLESPAQSPVVRGPGAMLPLTKVLHALLAAPGTRDGSNGPLPGAILRLAMAGPKRARRRL